MKTTVAVLASLAAIVCIASANIEITSLDLKNEVVAIQNNGTQEENLTGLIICDGANHRYIFGENTTLAPGQSLKVFSLEGNDTENEIYQGRKRAIWNNDGDTATLIQGNKTISVLSA